MGESTFTLWCAEAGLIPNGSQIDKTGWDFIVEFPFNSGEGFTEIHKSAFECKVQVKATDKRQRKSSITLSNLRRLITAQMPTFFIFIEFDSTKIAQRAFIVHIDKKLIFKVLKRLHEVRAKEKNSKFNKKTMTILYDESHMMKTTDGSCLKEGLLSHIGSDMSEYVSKKKLYLESSGFEDGFVHVNFTTEGEDNLKKLIDVSIGLEKQVNIDHFKGTNIRFGIASQTPFIETKNSILEMPNLKPNAEGIISFREDQLSPSLSFDSKFYYSPLNKVLPERLRKMRIEGEFFDFTLNPHTGAANYSFLFDEGVRLEVKKYRDALKLFKLISSSGKKLDTELICRGLPKFGFRVVCKSENFGCPKELQTLECAVKLLSDFNVTDCVDISFDEISRYETEIYQLEESIHSAPNMFKFEFSVSERKFNPAKEVACIILAIAPIGSHKVGIFLILIGEVSVIQDKQFRLIPNNVVIEKKLVSKKNESFLSEDLVAARKEIEKKYNNDYEVVTFT